MANTKPKDTAAVQHKKAAICIHAGMIEPETEFLLDKLRDMGWAILRRQSGANIDCTRSIHACEALSLGAEWILWIDSDMVILPEQVEELERVANGSGGEATVVSALASRRGGDLPACSIYDPSPRFVGDVVNVTTGCGAACLLTHASVYNDMITHFGMREVSSLRHSFYPFFEKIKFWHKNNEFICLEEDIYGSGWPDGTLYWASEDQSFTIRAKLCGHPAWIHTGVQIGHKVKEIQFPDWKKADRKYKRNQKRFIEIPYGQRPSPPQPEPEVVPATSKKRNRRRAQKK